MYQMQKLEDSSPLKPIAVEGPNFTTVKFLQMPNENIIKKGFLRCDLIRNRLKIYLSSGLCDTRIERCQNVSYAETLITKWQCLEASWRATRNSKVVVLCNTRKHCVAQKVRNRNFSKILFPWMYITKKKRKSFTSRHKHVYQEIM
jgi:hypothetical protein